MFTASCVVSTTGFAPYSIHSSLLFSGGLLVRLAERKMRRLKMIQDVYQPKMNPNICESPTKL